MADSHTPQSPPAEPDAVPSGHGARAAGDRLRELADEEAARAESEASEAGSSDVGEPASDASPSALVLDTLGVEPCTVEALEALGAPAADYRPCPFCEGYGAVVADDLLARLPGVVEALAPFPRSSVFQRCNECDGWGSVLTGGRTAENGIQPCPTCMSHGYIDTRDNRAGVELGAGFVDVARHGWGERDGDPFTTPPPEGEPPAAGMEWDSDAHRWAYPSRVA